MNTGEFLNSIRHMCFNHPGNIPAKIYRKVFNPNPLARLRAKYMGFLEGFNIEENTILYESFAGRGMICSPYALFRYLLSREDFSQYTHVWVIDDFDDNAAVMEEYRIYSNVIFVRFKSEEYLKYLAVSKYLVNNVGFPGFFIKRKEQIYLNTWHGIPMKTMGFDIPGGNISSGNSAKNLLSADYLLSSGSYMTETAYLKSYKLDGIFSGRILETGFPRNDIFFHEDRDRIIEKMIRCGVDVCPDKKIILYAPTWKGRQYSQAQDDVGEYIKLIGLIEENVDTEKYQIFVKPHQIVYQNLKKEHTVRGKFIPAILDTNEILSVTDILVSDYSSIHFDFLHTQRPILFFIPDLAEFEDYRGLYLDINQLPGPVADSYEELENCFRNMDSFFPAYEEKYRLEKAWACPFDNGCVCQNVAEAVFRQKINPDINCIQVKQERKKMLLFAGNLDNHAAVDMLFSFLKLPEINPYDLTLLVSSGGSHLNLIDKLPQNIRVLYWKMIYTDKELKEAGRVMSLSSKQTISCHSVFYEKEMSRAFGNTEFDLVVSFSVENDIFNGMMAVMSRAEKILFIKDLKEQKPFLFSAADTVFYSSENDLKLLKPYNEKCRKFPESIEQQG